MPVLCSDTLEEHACRIEEMCFWHDLDLAHVFRQFAFTCDKRGVPLHEELNLARGAKDGLLYDLMQRGTLDVLGTLYGFADIGSYFEGNIEKSASSLLLHRPGRGLSWGLLEFGKNGIDIGNFKNGERHGKGKLHFDSDWYDEGDLAHNQMHGYGVDGMEGTNERKKVRILIDNVYRGNPHQTPWLQPRNRLGDGLKRWT